MHWYNVFRWRSRKRYPLGKGRMYETSTEILLFATVAFLSTKRIFWGGEQFIALISLLILQEAYKQLRLWKIKGFVSSSSSYLIVLTPSVFLAQAQGRYVLGICFQTSEGGQTRGSIIRSYLALKLETFWRDAMPLPPLAGATLGWQDD